MHFPDSEDLLQMAQQRVYFDRLLRIQLHALLARQEYSSPLSPRTGEEKDSSTENLVILVTSPEIIKRAKELRKNMTFTEQLVRQRLTEDDINYTKRRRQHPIANYILDFCNIEHKIIIEID